MGLVRPYRPEEQILSDDGKDHREVIAGPPVAHAVSSNWFSGQTDLMVWWLCWSAGRDQEWHWRALSHDAIDIDGKPISGVVKLRRVRGRWQYRATTDEEHREEAQRQALW